MKKRKERGCSGKKGRNMEKTEGRKAEGRRVDGKEGGKARDG
jgi:hypothetical protein